MMGDNYFHWQIMNELVKKDKQIELLRSQLEPAAEALASVSEKGKQIASLKNDIEFLMRHSGECGVCKMCVHKCIINPRLKPKCCDAKWRGIQQAQNQHEK